MHEPLRDTHSCALLAGPANGDSSSCIPGTGMERPLGTESMPA